MAVSRWKPEELLRDARCGDAQCLGRLLDNYRNYLAMLARCRVDPRLQGKLDASDLVQETYVEALQSFQSFRGNTEAELIAWLRQILASRLALASRRYLGAQARDVRFEHRLAEAFDRSSMAADRLVLSQTSPSGHLARHERAVLLADALAELPEDYREVILLRHMEGLPFRDVARQMGRSHSSVRQLWVRSLAALHQLLASPLGEQDHEPNPVSP